MRYDELDSSTMRRSVAGLGRAWLAAVRLAAPLRPDGCPRLLRTSAKYVARQLCVSTWEVRQQY
jgi:hypothetical protein